MREPKYREIADDLRSKVESGDLRPGSRLPTEIELMDQYDASRNTVRDAIKLLITRGLVETRPGQGTFVIEKINPFVTTLTGDPTQGNNDERIYLAEVRAKGRVATSSEPVVEIHLASPVFADALRVAERTQLISRHQRRYIDGTPWSLQTSFYPMSLVTELGASQLIQAIDIPNGAVAYLAEEFGLKQVGYRDSVAVRTPEENEAAFFRLPTDGRIPVFEIFRVGFDQNGNRFRLTVTVYPADRNRFLIHVGEVPQARTGDNG